MGIQISGGAGGLDIEQLKEFLQSEDVEQIGTLDAGIIFHYSSGETLEGVQVNQSQWVEVYGSEIHFSEV